MRGREVSESPSLQVNWVNKGGICPTLCGMGGAQSPAHVGEGLSRASELSPYSNPLLLLGSEHRGWGCPLPVPALEAASQET